MHSAERKEDKQMPKLLIIDGSSMLSTSYYGNLPKSILFAKTEEEKEKQSGIRKIIVNEKTIVEAVV